MLSVVLLPDFITKHWACSRADIDWKAEGIRSSALEFVAYCLSFFFTTGIALGTIVGPPSMPWRKRFPVQDGWHYRLFWNRRDCRHVGYGRGTPLSRGKMSSRPEVTPGAQESLVDRSCWYHDVSDADKAAEVSWLQHNVMGPHQAVWVLRITAKDRYSDRCWDWANC